MPDIASHRAGGVAKGGGVDFVLGDRFGRACHPALTDWIKTQLEKHGYRVAMNKPYAGGYITEHYGQPAHGQHALQIEINRTIYMDERNYERHHGYPIVQAHLGDLMAALRQDMPTLAAELNPQHTLHTPDQSAAE